MNNGTNPSSEDLEDADQLLSCILAKDRHAEISRRLSEYLANGLRFGEVVA